MITRQKQISTLLSREVELKSQLNLEKANRSIAELQKRSEQEVRLAGKTKGSIKTWGQEQRLDSGWAPEGSTHVRFKCRGGGAPTPAFTCTTKALNTSRSATGIGLPNGRETVVEVPIVASNTAVEVSFYTTDSNGGSTEWEFIEKYGKKIKSYEKPFGPQKKS